MFVTKYVDRNVNEMILQPGLLNTGWVTQSRCKQKEKGPVEKKKCLQAIDDTNVCGSVCSNGEKKERRKREKEKKRNQGT